MANFDTLNMEGIEDEYKFKKNKNPSKIIHRDLTLCIPVKEKTPDRVVETFRFSVEANRLAVQKYNIRNKPITSILVSDQSDNNVANEMKSMLEETTNELYSMFSSKGLENYFPKVNYLRMGNELKEIILNDWSDIGQLSNLIDHVRKNDAVTGKGLNMGLTSLLGANLFIDSDYRNRSPRQILALALPLSHLGYDAIVGTFERYHEDSFGNMERGGRVNATTRALFDLISSTSQMKEIRYPLCGDRGSTLEVASLLYWPLTFGVETSDIIQKHSYVNGFNANGNPLLLNKSSLQVNIGGSDDEPIGEGEEKEEVSKKVVSMTMDVARAYFATTSIEFLNRWNSSQEFMDDFEIYQRRALNKYRDDSLTKHGMVLEISGGISDDELRDIGYNSIKSVSDQFYRDPTEEQTKLRSNVLIPISQLESAIGPRIENLRADLNKHSHELLIQQ